MQHIETCNKFRARKQGAGNVGPNLRAQLKTEEDKLGAMDILSDTCGPHGYNELL